MAEIKSFRISDETKERLEQLSASIGGNKDRVFNTLMDAYSLEQEKTSLTDQAKSVETFEQYANTLVRLYLEALRAVTSSDDRVRGEFHNQLEENARTIKELRQQRDRASEEFNKVKAETQKQIDHYQVKLSEMTASVQSLEKELAAANEQAAAKQTMNEALLSQLKQAEEKEEQYEHMREEYQLIKKKLDEEKAAALQSLQKLENALKQAEAEKEKAVYEEKLRKEEAVREAEEAIRAKKDEEIALLQKKLSDLQTKQLTDQAKLQEAKTQLLSTRIELSEMHQKELNDLRQEKDRKIEALQSELLKACKISV